MHQLMSCVSTALFVSQTSLTLGGMTYPSACQTSLNNVTNITDSLIYVSYTVVTICPGASGMRFSCAIQMALTPSYNAVPSMFTVAPRGKTKRLMRRSMPFFSSMQRIVVGKVAELQVNQSDQSIKYSVSCFFCLSVNALGSQSVSQPLVSYLNWTIIQLLSLSFSVSASISQ